MGYPRYEYSTEDQLFFFEFESTEIKPGDDWILRASLELSSNSIFAYNVNPISGDEGKTNDGTNYFVRNIGALSFYFKLKQLN